MEQYFARQSANCCKLNFSNKLAPSHKYILSPKKPNPNPAPTSHKSAKKSLKITQSHQALTNSKDSKKSIRFQSPKPQFKEKHEQLNDYGQIPHIKGKTETKRLDTRKQLKNSAQHTKIKHVKSLDRNQFIHSPNKNNPIEDIRIYRFSQKPNFLKIDKQETTRGSVFVENISNSPLNFRQQPVFAQKLTQFYREIPNQYTPQHFYQSIPNYQQIPTYVHSPSKYQTFKQFNTKPYIDHSNLILTKTPILKKQSSTNYTENFKRIYGEVEMQDEIKHDLMVSLELNSRKDLQQDHGYHQENGVSMLTKCPPSQESTILPPESKLRKKFQYQIDSFANHVKSPERKAVIDKFSKGQSLLSHKPESHRMNRRQKFKSIVSVESQNSSSSGDVDSVIIDQHPHHLLSSHPIKSLL